MEGKSRGVVIKTGGETVMGSITALVAGLDSGQTSINMRTFIQEPLDGRFWGTLPGFAPILILINDRAVDGDATEAGILKCYECLMGDTDKKRKKNLR